MRFPGKFAGWASASAVAAALGLSACGGGSVAAPAPSHTHPAAAASSAPAASGGSSADTTACKKFHAGAVAFAGNVKGATDSASLSAAYGGFVPVVEEDQSGTEGTQLSTLFDKLVSELNLQASGVAAGSNPSNAGVISAENAVFKFCQPLVPSMNWANS